MLESVVHIMSSDLSLDFKFNDQSELRAFQGGTLITPYFIEITQVDGLWGSDIEREEYPIPGAEGLASADEFRRGKTITFTGKIWGINYAGIAAGRRYMQQALQELALRQVRFQLVNEPQIYYMMKVAQDLSIVESQQDAGMERTRGFVFAMRADDPRSYLVSSPGTLYPSWQT